MADLAATIATGRVLPRMAPVTNDEEQRKRITTIAMSGDLAVLVDNAVGSFGGPAIDAAVTSVEWSDRLLGVNKAVRMPMKTVFIVTANNIALRGDLARRILYVRLESPDEHPEHRQNFRYPDVEAHVRTNHARLRVAALNVLRAYVVAGYPKQHLSPWGSFEGWSSLVRGALVWLGLPDPADTRTELLVATDRESDLLARLIAGFEESFPPPKAVSAAEVARVLCIEENKHSLLRDAIAEALGVAPGRTIDPRKLGKLFGRHRDRVVGGRAISVAGRKNNEGVRWTLVRVRRATDALSAGGAAADRGEPATRPAAGGGARGA